MAVEAKNRQTEVVIKMETEPRMGGPWAVTGRGDHIGEGPSALCAVQERQDGGLGCRKSSCSQVGGGETPFTGNKPHLTPSVVTLGVYVGGGGGLQQPRLPVWQVLSQEQLLPVLHIKIAHSLFAEGILL